MSDKSATDLDHKDGKQFEASEQYLYEREIEGLKDVLRFKDNVLNKLEKERDALAGFLEKAEAALEFYTEDSINHHNYHALMGVDLTTKAKESLAAIREARGK